MDNAILGKRLAPSTSAAPLRLEAPGSPAGERLLDWIEGGLPGPRGRAGERPVEPRRRESALVIDLTEVTEVLQRVSTGAEVLRVEPAEMEAAEEEAVMLAAVPPYPGREILEFAYYVTEPRQEPVQMAQHEDVEHFEHIDAFEDHRTNLDEELLEDNSALAREELDIREEPLLGHRPRLRYQGQRFRRDSHDNGRDNIEAHFAAPLHNDTLPTQQNGTSQTTMTAVSFPHGYTVYCSPVPIQFNSPNDNPRWRPRHRRQGNRNHRN